MRIALVSTCALPAPPPAYGGTELVIAELAKALVQLGHDVTLFATGDSRPQARLWAHFDRAVWPPDDFVEYWAAAKLTLDGQNPFDESLLLPAENPVLRVVAALTNPVVKTVAAVTPRVVPSALVVVFAIMWLLSARILLHQAFLARRMLGLS